MSTDVRRNRTVPWYTLLALCAALAGGCQSRQFYFFKDEEMAHYRKVALEIEAGMSTAGERPGIKTAAPTNSQALR